MKILFFSVAICLMNCQFINTSPDVPVTIEISEEDRHLQNIYKKMETGLKRSVEKGVKALISEFLSAGESINLSTDCLGNFLKITAGVRSLKPWAISFLDASGKLNDGFLSGNVDMLGNYDQCLSSTFKMKNGKTDFRGRYCWISYKPYMPESQKSTKVEILKRTYENTRNITELLRSFILQSQNAIKSQNYYGLCVPSGCSLKDVENLTKYVGERIYMDINVQYCEKEGDSSYLDTKKIIIVCIFTFFGLLGIMSSTLEHYFKMKNVEFRSMVVKILLCFSITTNFSRFMNTKVTKGTLSSANGIRVLSVFFVIAAHKLPASFSIFAQANIVQNMIDYNPTFFFQIIINAVLTLEVFFFLSGFFNIYTRQKMEANSVTFSWWKIMLHRIWRIIPGYIFSILLVYLLKPRGPLSHGYLENYIDRCAIHWWRNLLFINNWFAEEKCFIHTWYIACDMQLYFIASFTIPVLIKNPKKGIFLNAAVIVCGLIFTASWVYLKKAPPGYLLKDLDKLEIIHLTHKATFCHIASYFSGIFMGYFFSRKENIKISKSYQLIGWIMASFLFTSMLFMSYRWNSGIEYTAVESMLYYTFSRPIYSLAVGWMMFCCITGHAGIINYILSLKIWNPLSQLTLVMYLISFPMQLFYRANIRRSIDSQWMLWIWEYFGDLCVSGLLSLIIVILMEKPIFALEKLVISDRDTEKKTENLDNVDNITTSVHLKHNFSEEKNKNATSYENYF